MLGRLLTVYGALNRTFGFSIKPLFTFWLYITFRSIATVTLWLDHLFFPGFKKAKLDRPVFIIGTPRSGTTFLHRFLEEHWSLACFQVWQMIMPSITGQKLLRPFIKPLARFNPARHHASHAHETGLDAVETDDALLSVRFIDGFFLYAWFLAWDDREHPRIFETLEPDAPEVHRDLSFYTTCLKRNIHGSGKERVLGKPFVGTMRIESMLHYFPDARFIYLVRDPTAVIPSGLSLLNKLSDAQRGTGKLPADVRQRYFDRLYEGEKLFYSKFHEAYTSGRIPDENLLVVRFPDMMEKFEDVMDAISTFADLPIDDELRATIHETAEGQRAHKSKHKYDLETFGLSEEKIREELDFVYETHDL